MRMTRRVTVLLLAATAASAAWAPPANAAFAPLTEARARKLALSLATRVARERDVVVWHLSSAVKVRRTRIVFVYDDRNRDNVFCLAKVIVEQTARTRSVTIGAGRCAAVPAEALAIERATNAVVRAVRAKIDAVGRSINAYDAEVERCEDLVVPRRLEDEVADLFDAGSVVTAYSPVFAQLDGFVTALQNIQPEDPELVRGVVAWRRYLILIEAIPRPASDACPATQQWAANGFAPEAAPVDFPALRDLVAALERQEVGIAKGAERLEELGVLPEVVFAFDPGGLLLRADGVRPRP